MIENHSPLHERLKHAVEHPVPVPPPQPEHERAHTSMADKVRHQHADDMADYAVEAMAFRKGVREHIDRVEAKVDKVLELFVSAFENAEFEDEEDQPQFTLDGDPVPAERDQTQSLG